MTRKDDLVHEVTVEAPRARKNRWALLLLLVAFIISLLAAFGAGWYSYSGQKDRAETEAAKADSGQVLAAQVAALCKDKNHDSKYPNLSNLCDDAKNVAAGKLIQGPPGPQGQTGETGPGPTQLQIDSAVDRYCTTFGCAKGPSANQVAEAVALYCNSNNKCLGPEGDVGPQGATGNTGQTGATGATGPPPSDSQIASAVATYCTSHDNCQGPQGPKGDTGAQGDPGTPGDTVTDGSCQFDGIGTIQITINTSTGPTTFQCSGIGGNGGNNG